jgi:glycosyltransferase involved in cell wall biosynthesis
LGIDNSRCHLNGPTSNIQQEYANSSLFVFSSRFEGFGMVLVEAMSCGLPVVSFACPCGPKDIVRDGDDGLLVESGNIDKLAEAMMKMIREDNLRTSMAQAAQTNVERFRIERIAQQWKQLFTSL